MSPEEFGNRLRIAHDRIANLSQYEDVDSEQAVEELRSAVEELRVADEELRAQNEELVTAHLEVEAERRRYHELFDLAPDAYLVTNLAGIIDEANLSASRLLGISREFLIGKALAAYIATNDRVRFRSLLSSRDRAGISRPLPFRVRARGGTNLHVELTYSIIDDERGQPTGFRWIVLDVTEQERMARQIRSLNTEPSPALPNAPARSRPRKSCPRSSSRGNRRPAAPPKPARPSLDMCRSWRASACWPEA